MLLLPIGLPEAYTTREYVICSCNSGHWHARAKRATRTNDGFTMVELIIVMVILAILAAVSTPFISLRQSRDTTVNAAVSTIWSGIEAYRVDHQGLFPTYAMLRPGQLKGQNGTAYLHDWPNDIRGTASNGGKLLVEASPTGSALPFNVTSPSANQRNTWRWRVFYYVNDERTQGWLIAYGGHGTLVFSRGAGGATPARSVG